MTHQLFVAFISAAAFLSCGNRYVDGFSIRTGTPSSSPGTRFVIGGSAASSVTAFSASPIGARNRNYGRRDHHPTRSELVTHRFSFPQNNVRRMSSSSNADDGVDEERRAGSSTMPALAVVDTLSLMGFAVVGKASHTGPDGSIDPVAVTQVALPFVVSWFITSPITGVYDQPRHPLDSSDAEVEVVDSSSIVSNAALTAVQGWIVAVPLGIVFRGLVKGYVPPLPFVIVTMVATLVILSISRVLFALLVEQQSSLSTRVEEE